MESTIARTTTSERRRCPRPDPGTAPDRLTSGPSSSRIARGSASDGAAADAAPARIAPGAFTRISEQAAAAAAQAFFAADATSARSPSS